MKVIKRDGRIVDYDRKKIIIAIEKANNEVARKKEKANKEDIKKITKYIEEADKKRILVEDIQDIIEEKLMELGKYILAKKYIVYRYRRALVRKSNTTDESILGIIRNENKEFLDESLGKNMTLATTQRDYIAGEVSRDLTKRLLLPEKISKANDEGILYFHNADYFIQPIINSSFIDIQNMLDNNIIINNVLIEPPKSFQVACIVTTQIIWAVASNQYGELVINLKHLAKYLRRSKENLKKELEQEFEKKLTPKIIEQIIEKRLKTELSAGIQIIQYQINTLMITNGQQPLITLFLHLDENDEYIEENAMIIEELLKQRDKGIKNESGEYITPSFPKLIYVLDEPNCLKGGKYDYLTRLAIKCKSKVAISNYISAKKMKEKYERNIFSPIGINSFLKPWKDEKGNYKYEGRFNQGIVSINLPQIAIIADENETKFWELLEERLELCKEALMCRHYALLGTTSDISPIHWQSGAISSLNKSEKINELLYGGYSSISLGYVGINEMTKLIKGVSHTSEEGKKFALSVIKYLKKTVERWEKETNIGFSLDGTPSKNVCKKFARIDKEKFGNIEDITDKGYYTNSYHVNNNEDIDIFEKLKIESEFQNLLKSGVISYIDTSNINNDKMEEIIKFIYDNIQYAEFI